MTSDGSLLIFTCGWSLNTVYHNGWNECKCIVVDGAVKRVVALWYKSLSTLIAGLIGTNVLCLFFCRVTSWMQGEK